MARPVLLVEDDDEAREALRAVLRSLGVDVICARDGLEALRFLWRGLRPNVILLDVMLPNVDGFTFRELQQANWSDIPVIVVSAIHDLPEHVEALKPLAWFKKPVDVDALTEAVARYC